MPIKYSYVEIRVVTTEISREEKNYPDGALLPDEIINLDKTTTIKTEKEVRKFAATTRTEEKAIEIFNELTSNLMEYDKG
jgi:hypothetical protein